jgi:hypothetical protein
MRLRRQTVEHPFGTIKSWMGATHFQMKTLKNVSTDMALHVLAYNMKRIMSILGRVWWLDGGDPSIGSDLCLPTPVCAFLHSLDPERTCIVLVTDGFVHFNSRDANRALNVWRVFEMNRSTAINASDAISTYIQAKDTNPSSVDEAGLRGRLRTRNGG